MFEVFQTLPRSLPEEQGVSSSGIRDFLASLKRSDIELLSFMLLRHGAVISEAWWSPYEAKYPYMIFSLSKCFTSTAVGLAVSEKKLSLDDRVVTFFPDEEILEDKNLNVMRVRDLLTMSSGHNADIMGDLWKEKNGNWLKAFLTTPVEHPPGTHFAYNNGAAYMLSAILQKVTGVTLLEYLHPRLFEPLGIVDVTWDLSPGGRNPGGWGLILKTEDIARFGQLYLNKGVWQGNRIVSE
jgi:CubicO group peptidase (beta-lactamase class C family)